jgi:Autoinducer binding domain
LKTEAIQSIKLCFRRLSLTKIIMTDLLATARLAPFQTFEQATDFLVEQAFRASVKHLSYWLLQFVDGLPDHVVWVSTYDPRYMSQYMSNYTPLGDPVLERVMDDSVVIDWSEWATSGTAREIQEAATPFDISKFGLSLPLKGEGGDKVIFSVNAFSNEKDWPVQRGVIAQRFRPFAQDFHVRMRPMIAAREKGQAVYSL